MGAFEINERKKIRMNYGIKLSFQIPHRSSHIWEYDWNYIVTLTEENNFDSYLPEQRICRESIYWIGDSCDTNDKSTNEI